MKHRKHAQAADTKQNGILIAAWPSEWMSFFHGLNNFFHVWVIWQSKLMFICSIRQIPQQEGPHFSKRCQQVRLITAKRSSLHTRGLVSLWLSDRPLSRAASSSSSSSSSTSTSSSSSSWAMKPEDAWGLLSEQCGGPQMSFPRDTAEVNDLTASAKINKSFPVRSLHKSSLKRRFAGASTTSC